MSLLLCWHIIFISLLSSSNTAELATQSTSRPSGTPPHWDREVIRLAETLPIQSEGRIKPLSTYARFMLMRLSGKTSVRGVDGKRLSPTEWLLLCLFYPEKAQDCPVFIVHDQAVLENVGLPGHGKKRDRYSYRELLPARATLMSQAQQYAQIPPAQRSRIQEQILHLADNVLAYEEMIGYLEFTRFSFPLQEQDLFSTFFPNKQTVSLGEIVQTFPEVKKRMRELSNSLTETQSAELLATIRELLTQVSELVRKSEHFAVIPPADPSKKEWVSPVDTIISVFDPTVSEVPDIQLFTLFTQLERAKGEPFQFKEILSRIVQEIQSKAEIRGEAKKIHLEVFYYRGNFLQYSQWIFFLALILTALWWLSIENTWLKFSVTTTNIFALALLITAIVLRCIIRSRPPVTTLYETILFTTATAVLLTLVIERFTADNVPLSLTSFIGLVGLFIANRYEMKEAVDTMPSLVAVLDTNFWLTVHVTTIVIGYGAGFVASAFAHVWILGKLFGLKKQDSEFYRRLSQGLYGTICFCFFFSFIGTVLGGIWALESWGRFWGWDPKENGALLIVLWCLIIIHAHLGRMIGDLGKVIGAILLGIVVSFSWWGVNLLGVGLHSYGFTRGVWTSLLVFWVIESVFILVGIYAQYKEHVLPSTMRSVEE